MAEIIEVPKMKKTAMRNIAAESAIITPRMRQAAKKYAETGDRKAVAAEYGITCQKLGVWVWSAGYRSVNVTDENGQEEVKS